MTKIIKRAVRVLRQLFSNGKKRTLKKTRNNKIQTQKGGSVYSFNLDDKIGGMPATMYLNGTIDGDCPSGNSADLGFTNYDNAKGGQRKKSRKGKKSHSRKGKKSHARKGKKSHSRKH